MNIKSENILQIIPAIGITAIFENEHDAWEIPVICIAHVEVEYDTGIKDFLIEPMVHADIEGSEFCHKMPEFVGLRYSVKRSDSEAA